MLREFNKENKMSKSGWIKDIKVAKTTVKEENVVFSDETKKKSANRLSFHLHQMANLINQVGGIGETEEDYRNVQKELIEVVVERTSKIILKDPSLDVREVPQISLEREIPYCIPASDDRDDFIQVDLLKHLNLIPDIKEAQSAIPLDITKIVNSGSYGKRPDRNNENQLNGEKASEVMISKAEKACRDLDEQGFENLKKFIPKTDFQIKTRIHKLLL